VRFGIGPYCSDAVGKDISDVPFSISFDDSTNSKSETPIRYFSPSSETVVGRYLDTNFIDHATGSNLCEQLLKTLEKHDLKLRNMIGLGRDGPNVNKTVTRLINAQRSKDNLASLPDIGPCPIHISHNGFHAGLNGLSEIENLVMDLYFFFKRSPTRRADLKIMQFEESVAQHALMKHGQTRWTTLGPCADRLDEQFDVVRKFILEEERKGKRTNRPGSGVSLCV
jgi:hypothetical protein